jgi:hypothetical protein
MRQAWTPYEPSATATLTALTWYLAPLLRKLFRRREA